MHSNWNVWIKTGGNFKVADLPKKALAHPTWLKRKNKKKRRSYSPIPVLLVLIGSDIFVCVVVDQYIVILLISGDLRRVKVQAEEIGRTCKLNLLGWREDRKSWLGKTRGRTLPTNLYSAMLCRQESRIKQLSHERKQEVKKKTIPDRSSLGGTIYKYIRYK